MMNCNDIEAQDAIERYLTRSLSEVEQQAFEDHYFGCADCFERLRIARALQLKPEAFQSKSWTASYFSGRMRLVFLPVASAIVAATLAAVYWSFAPSRVTTPSQGAETADKSASPAGSKAAEDKERERVVSQLAHVDPPPYAPRHLREAEDESRAQFEGAMAQYLRGDYPAAIVGLRKAARLNPKAIDANFYLGACYLLTNQPDAAVDTLQKAISLDAPDYAEQAHFYLAKAYLQKHNLASAQLELESSLKFHGVRESEAKRLKQDLDALQKHGEGR